MGNVGRQSTVFRWPPFFVSVKNGNWNRQLKALKPSIVTRGIILMIFGGLSLVVAIAVYSFARETPPDLLSLLRLSYPTFLAQSDIFGSAPSFFYTLSVSFLISAIASPMAKARRHILFWVVIALLLELSQYAAISRSLIPWVSEIVPLSIWEIVGPYWENGIFDYRDLLATVLAGAIALAVIVCLKKEHEK